MDTVTLSKIAHELRTPLTLIHSTMQLIEAQLPQMKELKYWIRLNEDFRDMTELVTSLTSFQSGTGDYPDEVDLYCLLQNLRESFLSADIGKGASLSLSATEEAKNIAESFHCDRIRLKQACTNLIKNALEATLGQIHRDIGITLSTSHIPLNEDTSGLHFLCITVRDNGPGIPPEILPHLYTPFVSGKKSGTGIGLSITRSSVLEHNGYLDVETSPAGTTFLIYLPYQK